MRKTRRFLLLVVVLVPCILLKRSEAQGDCDIDEDCRAGQCCSTYGYCQSVTKKQDIRESPKDNSYSPYSFVAFQHESTDR